MNWAIFGYTYIQIDRQVDRPGAMLKSVLLINSITTAASAVSPQARIDVVYGDSLKFVYAKAAVDVSTPVRSLHRVC